MIFCTHRNCLSREDALRRSYYEVLRDELDQFVLGFSLVGSYNNFMRQNIPYPFVETRELKPRARVPAVEYKAHNSFLIIFSENSLDAKDKKYIRFFDVNKTTKENLSHHNHFPDIEHFKRNVTYLETEGFFTFLRSLMSLDYALLIQPNKLKKVRYALTHFHVRIDWPIADAAEDLARDLRYISRELYEKGDKYAEDFQKKFFEYYGVPVMAGGRRTAAIVAAQYFRRFGGITTIYVGSSESRSLIRIDERGISTAVLIRLTDEEIKKLSRSADINQSSLTKNYVIARDRKYFICMLRVNYDHTSPALPSEGGKLRELKPDTNWLTVSSEQILPKPSVTRYAPIPIKMIYA